MPNENAIAPWPPKRWKRLPAVDAIRGLVMLLMTVDHASYAFNAERYVTDARAWYEPGSVIPVLQFLVRWMTHVCAPTFLFLAGFALAVSLAHKQAAGIRARQIDRDLMIRGLFIMALDPLWMSLGFGGGTVWQVLYAIGGGLCCMVWLRRMNSRTLAVISIGLFLGCEALLRLAIGPANGQPLGWLPALLATGGRIGAFGYVLYPLLPWLAYMLLGHICGRGLVNGIVKKPALWSSLAAAILGFLFLIVRGLNSYGNMQLYRDDLSLLQWLHVSKYPPSLSFTLLTLSMMYLAFALFTYLYRNGPLCSGDPLTIFGQTPLFFYILHVHLLQVGAKLTGLWKAGGLTETWLATAAVLIVLYPLCRWYAGIKKTHPGSLLRFV